jgi:signal transduction histidine kinase
MLVGIRLQLNNFAAENGAQSEQAAHALQKGMDELAAAIVEARRVIEGLRPAELDDLGLATPFAIWRRRFAPRQGACCT